MFTQALFKKNHRSIKAVMIPVEICSGLFFIKDTLNLLTKNEKDVAVVLDEYGGIQLHNIGRYNRRTFGEVKMNMMEEFVEKKNKYR
jgi:hypothetical protein